MITTLASIIQTPQAYPLEQILDQKPSYMEKIIDYISVVPDPFIMNQRQCYFYPIKSIEILNSHTIYKILVKKHLKSKQIIDVTKQHHQCDDSQYTYPYLQRLFKNIQLIENQQILLGYVDRLLFSVTKKTPEIYEFFKDDQNSLLKILKIDKILFALKDFLILFLAESTMMLYVFLKNMVLRTLMYRIVENESTGPIVYEILCDFYSELLKAYLCQNNSQDKQQISEVLKNIQEQNFIALLALKISPQHHRRTYFIAKILNQIASSPNQVSSLVTPYIDTYTQYLESYEESEDFLLVIMPDQFMMLKLILKICSNEISTLNDIKEELAKRLLVYSNIHQKNSIIHNMLFTLVVVLHEQGNSKILIKSKIIEFLKNNFKEQTSLNLKGLIKRISLFYVQKNLDNDLENEDEKYFIRKHENKRKQKLSNCQYFKEKQNQSQLFQANFSQVSEKSQRKQKASEKQTESHQK